MFVDMVIWLKNTELEIQQLETFALTEQGYI